MTKIEFKEIQRFVRLVEQSEISELEIVQEGVTLRIKKELSLDHRNLVTTIPQPIITPVPSSPQLEAVPKAIAPTPEPAKKSFEVKSPMVGTFYRAPSPEAEPYVQVGDMVKPGQVLCIIEAMKLMNEIECEVSGKIVEICAENAKPVEFGQVLFRIEQG
jgi:acetyl-CoA carboxylase biotin carboxyl carrier protein